MSAHSWGEPEWRLGEASVAYSTKNTCLAFLFSPAPFVWQPAFRVKSLIHGAKGELPLPDLPPPEFPPGVVVQHVVPRA